MHDTTIPALDICAGAGGFSLGLQRAGFQVFGLELDPDACDTHRRHVGPCKRVDVRTYHPRARFALVAGGVPCQPFSMAGERLGVEDPRYLVPDFLRIAREAHAEAVVIENVRGLVHDARSFRIVLDAVEAEWLTTWTVLDAADYGVPQHRDRVFIVGFRDAGARAAFRWPMPTHAPPGTMFGAPYVTVRQALALPSTLSFSPLDQPAPCVTATEHKSAMNGTQPMKRRRRASERLSDALGALDQPAPTVRANAYHEAPDPVRASRRPMANVAAALEEAGLADRPATTVQADPRVAVAGHHDRQQNGAVRLTPEQCALLQGFPAGWQWTGNKGSQHRQIGNAVPPALAEAVGRSILNALR